MCKKLITVLTVGFLIAGFVSDLQASIKLNFTGNGARAAAMGYAFTGIADDATAISWNSAGLTQLYSMEACAIGRLGFGSCSWDYESAPDIEQKTNFQLNFLSLAFPFKAGNYNVVGGIALRKIYDFGSEFTYTFSDDSELLNVMEGGINAISPAMAVQINDMLSFGAAFNIYYGSKDYYTEVDGNKSNESTYDYSGTSIDLGIMVKPNEKFSIGANLNLPNTITEKSGQEEKEDFEIDVPFFFSVGGAFRATDQLTLALDYHSRLWSNSDLFENSEDIDVDLNSFHAGLEYLITSGNAVIPVRLGFYTNPLHEWVVNSEWDYSDQITNNVFTLGAGLIMGSFIFDAAFEFESSSYETFADDFYLYNEEFTIEENNFRMTLGGTFHFGN